MAEALRRFGRLGPSVAASRAAAKPAAALGAVLVLLYVVLPALLPVSGTTDGRWQTPAPYVLLGVIQGVVYGLLSVGLVLIYRSNRIINFAHGQIGVFGAGIFWLAAVRGDIPYFVAFVPALAASAAAGAVAEAVVIRRLRKAPPLMSIVATLGVGTVLFAFATVLTGDSSAGTRFPQPPFPDFTFGALLVTPAYFAMLVLSPLVVLGIAAFLKFTKFGLGIRAAAANPEAARMAGISSARMSSLAWAIAGGVAAFGAILTAPTLSIVGAGNFGPSLLLRALVGAVIARMTSLPVALAGGIVLGIAEQLLMLNFSRPGIVDLALFLMIVVAMSVQRQVVGRTQEKGSWAAVQAARPLPAELREIWVVRNLGALAGLFFLAAVALLPLVMSNSDSVKVAGIIGYVVVGVSVSIVTGFGGQVSLGQFAVAAVGAIVSYQVARRTGNYLIAFGYAGAVSALVAVFLGLPALRIKGLLLTVTTLAFAVLVPSYVLVQPWAFGAGADPGRPVLLGNPLTGGKEYVYVALAVLVAALAIARNVRSGGLGRLLISVRDNEDAARAFTVSAIKVKIVGFALAGFVAGIGGAMYGHLFSLLTTTTFPTQTSIDLVVMSVIGGIGLLYGPILGAVLVFALPTFVELKSFAIFATSLGHLLIIMYLPGGVGQLVTPVRDWVAKRIGRANGIDVEAAFLRSSGSAAAIVAPKEVAPIPSRSGPSGPIVIPARQGAGRRSGGAYLLEATELRKNFGGVAAVRGVSFGVAPGEILGLIGPNGAGKTTTFELLAGFTKADHGRVEFAGRDVTGLTPEARARLGLIRSFQDAALFQTLSVKECVQLALERVDPTSFVAAIAGLTGQEKRKDKAADEWIGWLGLERYRSAQIQELSTGTRRMAEIACLVALEPRLLLLDEPSSGIAQRETEALGELLVRLRVELDLTMIVIEHDIPLIMGLSDRVVAMADGEVIAIGSPEVVRNSPAVVEAYLGGSVTAIERSAGVGPSAAAVDAVSDGDETRLLCSVSGLSTTKAASLLRHFGGMDALRRASELQLCEVPGIGIDTARRVRAGLRPRRTRSSV